MKKIKAPLLRACFRRFVVRWVIPWTTTGAIIMMMVVLLLGGCFRKVLVRWVIPGAITSAIILMVVVLMKPTSWAQLAGLIVLLWILLGREIFIFLREEIKKL